MFSELKRLLKQSAIYGVGSIVSPFIGFVMLPVYSRFLTPAEYGILAVTVVVTAFLSALVSFGVNAGLMRFYFAYSDKKDKDEVVVSSLFFSFLSSIAFVLALWFFSRPISDVLFDFEKGELYFKLVLLTSVMDTGMMNCLAVLRAEEKPVTYSVVTVLRLALTLSLNILFVVVLRRNVQGILEAELLSGTISYAAMLIIVLRGKVFSVSWLKIRQVLSFGIPLIPGNIASLIMTLSDRYFLKHYATMDDVGLYSVGTRVAAALRIALVEPFRIAWPPYMFSVTDKPDAKEIYRNVLVYFTFISVWAGLLLSCFAKEGLMLLATPAYYSGYRVVPLLVVSHVLVGMCTILVAGIQITNRTKYASYSFLAAAAVSLAMNFALVPRIGMMGAATASVGAYAVLNLLYFFWSQRFYYISHDFRRIILAFVAGIVMYGLSTLLTSGMNLVLGMVTKLVVVLLYPALLYVFRFYTETERRKLHELWRGVVRGRPPRG